MKAPERQRQYILDQPYNFFVLENELESFEKITSEREMAILRAEEWRLKAEQYKDETCQLLEDMAQDTLS